MRYILMAALLLNFAGFAMAGGTFELEGKIRGFDASTVKINDGFNVYTIRKDQLGPLYRKNIKKAKVGGKLKLVVPFQAVAKVKSI